MKNKKLNYTILLAIVAFILCLPMLLWDSSAVSDVAARYAPMTKAFVKGDWQNAFHPRIPPLLILLSGTIAYLFQLGGTVACEIISALFFAITVFPLTALMRKVFNYKYALWTTVMFICCSRLLRIAGMGLRDSAKCFFLVLATYGLVCFFQKYNWKGALYCALSCVGLALIRGDSLLFALLFMMAIAIIEISKLKRFPYKSFCAGVMFLILISPWCCYEYQKTGWPVTELRHAMLLDKIFKTEKAKGCSVVINVTDQKSSSDTLPRTKKGKTGIKYFLKNLLKGFYPQYLLFIIPVLFFRIKRKILTSEELILLSVVLIHAAGMIGQIAVADKRLFIYKRYLIVATPLLFGWAAIGLRWLFDKTRRFLNIKYRWLAKAAIVILIIVSLFDAWSRVRKAKLNPFLYKTFKQYTGINLKR